MSQSQWTKISLLLLFLTNINAVCKISQVQRSNYYHHNEANCVHITFRDLIKLHKTYPNIPIIHIAASDESFLNAGIFHDMNYLKEIYITHSNISKVTREIFSSGSKLEIVDLTTSNISTIEEGSFSGLHNLRTLNISQNNFVNVNFFNGDGIGCYLKNFDLSHNHISNITGLKVCSDLVLVNLSFNALTQLQSKQFIGLTKLIRLNLKGNSINNLEDNCFFDLKVLQVLELAENQLTHIPVGSFKDTVSLMFLNLSHNKIDFITLGTFAGLASLQTLDLSFNKISSLQADVLLDVYSITKLIVDYNFLTDLNSKDMAYYLQQLRYVSLDGNNWTCSKLSDVIRNFRPKRITIELGTSFKDKNLNGITCSGDGNRINSNQPDQNLHIAWENMKRYFESDFKQSKFYQFFTREFPNIFQSSIQDISLFKHFDDDFLNSKFYKYFTGDYINAKFFEFLDKKIEAMKTLREGEQFNKTDYEEMIKKTFSEYFSSLKSNSEFLRDVDVEEEANNDSLKTLNKLVIALLLVLLLIWAMLTVAVCKLYKINVRVNFGNVLRFGRSRNESQNHEDNCSNCYSVTSY